MTSRPILDLCIEKRYRRWFLLVLIPLLSPYMFNEVIDSKFSLCSVRCRHSFGTSVIPSLDTSIEGNRPMFASDRCDCYQRTNSWISTFLGSISWHETSPPPLNLNRIAFVLPMVEIMNHNSLHVQMKLILFMEAIVVLAVMSTILMFIEKHVRQ